MAGLDPASAGFSFVRLIIGRFRCCVNLGKSRMRNTAAAIATLPNTGIPILRRYDAKALAPNASYSADGTRGAHKPIRRMINMPGYAHSAPLLDLSIEPGSSETSHRHREAARSYQHR